MWQLSAPWWEFVVRAVVVYFFLLALLRITGKRQVGQLAPFDLVLLLILSNAVQNAMNAGDNSVLAGFILAISLVAVNYLVALATFRSRRLEALVEGKPEVLIYNGRLFRSVLDREKITDLELITVLRAAGCEAIEDVHLAVLENNGHVSVLPKNANQQNDTAGVPKLNL